MPPPAERCANCLDDDGDGLVDYEDPDCCTATLPATVRSAVLRAARPGTRRGTVRLEAVLPPGAALEPLKYPTSLQIADGNGELLCATITTGYWRQRGKQNFVFHDPRARFGGLTTGRIRRLRDGSQALSVRGGRVPLRVASGSTLAFTVHGGGVCARTALTVGPARSGVGFR